MKKYKNILISIIPIALMLAALVFVGANATPGSFSATGTGQRTVSLLGGGPKFDFGSISMAAGKVTHSFTIKNTTAQPIEVARIYTSCMCTEAFLKMDGEKNGPFGMPGHMPLSAINRTLPVGGTASIEAVFDPVAHGPSGLGHIERSVIVENNSTRIAELDFSADVTP